MIKLSQAIIVEGKYDKIKLSSLIDTIIIEVNGFQIYKDKEKAALIKHLADTCGIIIMTDSDYAGIQLRNKIKEIAGNGTIFNAYIPEVLGKERRKTQPSRCGFLGVEGVDKEIILSALESCGLERPKQMHSVASKLSEKDLYNLGLTGKPDSKRLRSDLLRYLNLPTALSKNNLLKILQMQYNLEQIENILNQLRR